FGAWALRPRRPLFAAGASAGVGANESPSAAVPTGTTGGAAGSGAELAPLADRPGPFPAPFPCCGRNSSVIGCHADASERSWFSARSIAKLGCRVMLLFRHKDGSCLTLTLPLAALQHRRPREFAPACRSDRRLWPLRPRARRDGSSPRRAKPR